MNRFFASASVILGSIAGCLCHVFVPGLAARATEPAIISATVVPLEIPPARRVAVPLAPFLETSPTFEDAFAAAVAAAADRVAAERAAGVEAVRAVVELPPGRHRVGRPLGIQGRNDLGIDGGGCTIVQTAVDDVFEITACRNVMISNLTIDYDPLPFTQGRVAAINGNGNTIDDSYAAALEITNADGVLVRGNTIGETFLCGSFFAAGKKFGIVPDAAVIVAMSLNVSLVGNAIATGPVARRPVSIHSSCDASVRTAP